MSFSPLLVLHISAGSAALLAGTAAMIFPKGSRPHRRAGSAFVVSMLLLAATGAFIGFSKGQELNGFMGVQTFYLVVTAWLTAKRRDGEVGPVDWAALAVALAAGAALVMLGLRAAGSESGTIDGYPPVAYFIFGSMALFFAAGDIRMRLRGGVSGTQRIKRHLSRMCVALFIATGSFFLGQPQVFPEAVRKTNLLFVPAILPLVLLIFWRLRVRFAAAYRTP